MEKQLELLTGFSLLFDRLHGLHDLLLLDAKLLLLFGFPIFATEISVITSIVPRLRLLEDLVERAMIILQRKHARIFGLRHGWDWIKGASRPEKIGQILWHFFFGDVAHHTVVPEVYHKITHKDKGIAQIATEGCIQKYG